VGTEDDDAKIALPDALGDLFIETILEFDPSLVIPNIKLVLQSLVKRFGYDVHIFGRVAQEQFYLIFTHRVFGRDYSGTALRLRQPATDTGCGTPVSGLYFAVGLTSS
jgi:hypothetical protein